MRRSAIFERGACIIYVSHKFDEIFRISDRMSVFREGSCVATIEAAKTDRDVIVRLMVGRTWQSSEDVEGLENDQTGIPALEVEGISARGKFEQISFRLRPKEILGVAGLVGSGRTEILRAIFGVDVTDVGSVRVAGEPIANPRPDRMIDVGVAFVPEDRRTQGLIRAYRLGCRQHFSCRACASMALRSARYRRGKNAPTDAWSMRYPFARQALGRPWRR